MSNKAALIIMDGWGLGQVPSADAILAANTPFVDEIKNKYPYSTLVTYGTEVGLPEGQMGNSEVGHLNIGAGRIVYQELERINVAIHSGELEANKQLLASMQYAKENNKTLHLMGLVSDGGVHSHINHLKAIVKICSNNLVPKVAIHAFTDGRDTDPKSGRAYLQDLNSFLNNYPNYKIASITGRYFAMDRDKRWERVKVAFDALVHGKGKLVNDIDNTIANCYANNETDEFIKPIIIKDSNDSITTIQDGDAALCFNFRTDRCREISIVLTQQNMPEYDMHTLNLHYTTCTQYDKTYNNIHVLFTNDDVTNTLGEAIAKAGKTQLRAAETEKYPHVTFFFNGGKETSFDGEQRVMAESPKDIATYDLKPSMSAIELTTKVLEAIQKDTPDFICLNYANTDMVGHTGVWNAVVQAAETVDSCVAKVVDACMQKGYTIFVTADHGNADYMINEDGTPNTAHTTNPVPFIVVSNKNWQVANGKLGDIAPTILHSMGIAIPTEMTGVVLISNT
jgi:2,3-bisphosphoglycerate-independent phosphoglycerate mutase